MDILPFARSERFAAHRAPPSHEVSIPPLGLAGTLNIPAGARALVVFVHGSGSSRFSPRNRAVADALNERAFATLLFDLLTEEEEADRANVFDIALLAERLAQAVDWIDGNRGCAGFRSAFSGQAPAPRRRSSPRRASRIGSAPSYRAAVDPISRARLSTG